MEEPTKEALLLDAGKKACAIITKMGGQEFLTLTGAHRLEAMDNGVLFALPSNFSKHGINRIKVRLNDRSTYDMRFIKSDTATYTRIDVAARNNIDGDALRATFTEVTGLGTEIY